MQGQSPLHRKAKIPFPAGCVAHSPAPCRPGSEAGVPGAVAPCIGKPKSPSPLGSCAAGSARAARVQPRGCKGRSPLHKITLVPPLPAGKGGGGMGAGNKAKGKVRRQPQPPSPPLGTTAARSIQRPEKPAPPPGAWRTPLPRAARIQPRGCKGRSPLHKITLVSPFPAGEERSASAGRGVRGQETKLKAG